MRAIATCLLILVGLASWGGPARAEDEPVPRPPMADAAATMEAILEALEALPVRILKLHVRYGSTTLYLEYTEASAIEAARKALEADENLRAAARDPLRPVEVRALRQTNDRLQAIVDLSLRPDQAAPAPVRTATELSMTDMLGYATVAGLRQIYASRQRPTVFRKHGLVIISQRFEYEAKSGSPTDLLLARLRRLCSGIGDNDLYRVTEVEWSRPTDWNGTTDLIRRPRIEVSVWSPVPGAVSVSSRPGALAEVILRGPDSDLTYAEEALAKLDQEARLGTLRELRGQARIYAALDRDRVRSLSLEESDLDVALDTVLGPRRIPWQLSPGVRSQLHDQARLTLHLDGVPLYVVLSRLTDPYGIRMVVRADGIAFLTAEEKVQEAFPGPSADLLAMLYTTRVTLDLDRVSFGDVVTHVTSMTGFVITVDPRVAPEVSKSKAAKIHVEDMPVSQILDMLAATVGDEIAWTVKDAVVVFTKRELLAR